ncbi:MAG: hypothetical protein V4692_07375 [Bdellovibrionota bacterium]
MAIIDNEKGMATIEIVPLLILFVFLIAYTMGAFGIVHTGIKNSIAARNYAFETFRNRANLLYFRDTPDSAGMFFFKKNGNRQHTIISEATIGEEAYIATERPLRVGIPTSQDKLVSARGGDAQDVHNNKVFGIQSKVRNQKVGVNPVWLMVQYGICMDVRCGD